MKIWFTPDIKTNPMTSRNREIGIILHTSENMTVPTSRQSGKNKRTITTNAKLFPQ